MAHVFAQPSGYWVGPRARGEPCVDAEKISKTAWMDLYFDIYIQTNAVDMHGIVTNGKLRDLQVAVLAEAKQRLAVLKDNGIR